MIKRIVLPKMSSLMQKGQIVEIYVKDGQAIKENDIILSITAEKVNAEIEAPMDGYVKLQCAEGDELPVGADIAIIASTLEELRKLQQNFDNKEAPVQKEKDFSTANAEPEQKIDVRAQPIAKRLAAENGIDLETIKGTGYNGIITKEDVEKVIAAKNDNEEILVLDAVKKGMVEHMLRSKEYVQATTFMEIDMQRIKELREQKKASYTSYITVAVVKALKNHPIINSSFMDGKIYLKKHINLGVALDNQGKLVAPVLMNVENMGVKDIEGEIERLREKIETGKVTIDDISGGTFTITNSGIFGSLFFTPVINYPQSAILGIGKIQEKPVAINKNITIRPIAIFSLSYDHRIIEGSAAVKFLANVKSNLENFNL